MSEINRPAQSGAEERVLPVRMAMVGCGGMARSHTRRTLAQAGDTEVRVVCEPSPQAYAAYCELFTEAGVTPPPNVPDLEQMLSDYGNEVDAAFIITPHALHHDQATMCLEAGVDVLLEKPMVMNQTEAESLIRIRDRTGRLLVVAFQGSLSPHVRAASRMLRSGELGPILNISGVVWQGWKTSTTGTWRQNMVLSGGGFMFDTGAHLLNTVADLAGEDFVEVAAWMQNRGAPVDILAAVMGRLRSGAFVTLNGCGDTVRSCASDIRVFCTEAILRTGAWGGFLEMQRQGEPDLAPVELPDSKGSWEQFLEVRSGLIPNPSPPEVGLRMAKLWDAINESARQGGTPVKCG